MSTANDTSVEELLQSAKEFLVEALSNYTAGKHKLAIVHGVTAAELTLKARLARLHPALIFSDVDCAPSKKVQRRTIELRNIPNRLHNFGHSLTQTHQDLVFEFAEWRNDIVHHMPTYDVRAVNRKLPALIDFISASLRNDLNTRLETFLPRALFAKANEILDDWKSAVAAAREQAKGKANAIDDPCPQCTVTGVLGALGTDQAYCHLCQQKFDLNLRCEECGSPLPPQMAEGFLRDSHCRACIDAASERYVEELTDRTLGK